MLLWLLIWEKNCIQTYNCLLSCPVPAGRRCCGRGRRPPRGWCWGPGRSTAGPHPLGWPSRWSVRRSTCLPRQVVYSSAVCVSACGAGGQGYCGAHGHCGGAAAAAGQAQHEKRGHLGRVSGAGVGPGGRTFFRGRLRRPVPGGGHRHHGAAGGGVCLADAPFPLPGAAGAVPVAGHRGRLPAAVCPAGRWLRAWRWPQQPGCAPPLPARWRRPLWSASRWRRPLRRPAEPLLRGAGGGTGKPGGSLPLPRRAPALCWRFCGGLRAGSLGRPRCRRCAAAVCGRGCGPWRGAGCAGGVAAGGVSAARPAGADPGVKRCRPPPGRCGGYLKRHR